MTLEYKNKTDAELVALARRGEREAFGQLVERYERMARRIAFGMVANEEVARELAQEAILAAYLSLAHLRDETRFRSWLYGIVLNVCRSYLRERKGDPCSLEELMEVMGGMGGMRYDLSLFTQATVDPQRVAEERELQRIVLEAVQHLSPKDRTATLLFYYEQLSLEEIARVSGVSVTAVKGRLHRARKQLRTRLSPLYSGSISSEAPAAQSQAKENGRNLQQVLHSRSRYRERGKFQESSAEHHRLPDGRTGIRNFSIPVLGVPVQMDRYAQYVLPA
jgi:RNA polymerase sigma factor (sigma-70 family)